MATGSGVTSNDLEMLLEKVELGNLLSSFVDEKLNCQTLLSLLEKELNRLGVNTIGDRVRLRQVCRDHRAAAAYQHGNANSVVKSNGLNLAAGVQHERTLLFSPSNSRSRFGAEKRFGSKKKKRSVLKRPWTVHFVCLESRYMLQRYQQQLKNKHCSDLALATKK